MNKVSTVVYLLIGIAVLILALSMTKPEVVAATDKDKSYLKLWNYGTAKA
jgi:uncharacterized membrane protein YuzA (DUF378 family)